MPDRTVADADRGERSGTGPGSRPKTLVRQEIQTMRRNPTQIAHRGFSLIELVIVIVIIGIIAAIAIPRVTRGADRAGENATKSSLAMVRNAIELFKSEHGGTLPTHAEVSGTGLTATSTYGSLTVGPYLQALPSIRIGANQNSTIRNDADATREATSTEGWAYQPTTGVFYANVATGSAWTGNAFDW